jgi:hypothetical protein
VRLAAQAVAQLTNRRGRRASGFRIPGVRRSRAEYQFDLVALADISVVANTLSSAPLTAEQDVFDAVCSKPMSPDALVEVIRQAIRSRAG